MPEVVVVRKHKSNYPNPISFDAGDKLLVGERDTEYPGWARITDKKGDIGWAPLEYIELGVNGTSGVAVKSYSAKELDVEPGERLSVIFEHCQWCWVEHKTMGAGWVPSECFNPTKTFPQAHDFSDPDAVQIIPLADRKEHVWELAELHHAEWGHFSPSFSLQLRAEAIEKAAGREGIPSIFIATSKGELIGSAALIEQDMKTRPDLTPWLAAVYVKERFRNRGIASALIARCEAEAAQSGVTTWYLFTEFAAKLYVKLGWRHMESCDYKGARVNIMSKEIASSR